jgi:hypothetical protein
MKSHHHFLQLLPLLSSNAILVDTKIPTQYMSAEEDATGSDFALS